MTHRTLKTAALILIALAIGGAYLASSFVFAPHPSHAATTDNLSGYAWASTIGWVSFNCSNDNSCATNNYGVTVAADGTITGYAWSPNVGWISFNAADTANCPSGTCQATFNATSGAVTGWARAVAAESLDLTQTGSWSGWIHLSGNNYQVSATNCNWGGSAFGGGGDTSVDTIGWLKFSGTNYGVHGTGSACVTSPQLSCVATNTGGNAYSITASSPNGIPGSLTWTPSDTNTPVSSVSPWSHTFPTNGLYTVTVNATNYTQGTCLVGGVPASISSFTANPVRVNKNGTSKLTLHAINVKTSCTITDQNNNNLGVYTPTNGSVDVVNQVTPAIVTQTTYTASCDSAVAVAKVIVNLVPSFLPF